MKLLFVHDHPFEEREGEVYSGGAFPLKIWDNYTPFFESVSVFARKAEDTGKAKSISSGNDVVNFILTENYKSPLKLIKSYNLLNKELTTSIQRSEVILVRLPSILGYIAAHIALKKSKVLVIEQVGNAHEAFSTYGSFLGKVIAPALDRINKKLVRKANFVIYVTRSKLQKDYPSDASQASISNVVLPKIIEATDIDKQYLNNDIFHIGLTGGFDVKYKGQDTLLKAISLLDPHIVETIRLHFVGRGDFAWIRKKASELGLEKNIAFLGSKSSGHEIFDYLRGLHLYVQPSYTEGMPRALLEAMSVGVPVLGSSVGGIPDVVESSLLHTPKDYKKLSKDIARLYNNRDFLIEQSFRSVKMVAPFELSKLKARRQKLFLEIIKKAVNISH